MDKRKFNKFSIACFFVTVITFLSCLKLWQHTSNTSNHFSETGFIGYILFILAFSSPLVGLLFAFKGEREFLKPVLISVNLVTFLTLSLPIAVIAFRDYV
ncbi:hypothetical protein [Rummeliibacillus pycnus]|uniref:hypothetical protein n=1 Tax=Rummeliibacillus pycnus TaxID=101070 RepID=UPI000C9B17F9|nr:hypothetical protein [Rummeliibacillus pycnus]